jgi:hypothetical protein
MANFETKDKNGIVLLPPIVSSYRDLGVVVSSNLSPSAHINVIIAESYRRANMILQTLL